MSRQRRTMLLAALALTIPLPAFALPGEVGTSTDPAVADLGVSASLDSCGLLDTQIVCTLSVSYAALPNATSYTASVTSPDGSVIDFGSVPAGGTSLMVPYAGAGSYGVRVTAYGVPEDDPEGEEEVIATDVSENITDDGTGEPRVSDGPVKPEASTRHVPQADDSADDAGPVSAAPTCVAQPPAPEPTSEPEPAPETTTEVETTVTPEAAPTTPDHADSAVGRQATEAQTADPAQAEAPHAAPQAPETGDCPAP